MKSDWCAANPCWMLFWCGSSLLGDIIARYSICKTLGVNNRDLAFETNKYGKPILSQSEPQKVHFNISHSENWVVCAVDDAPVGIDVETIKPIDLEISQRFFSVAEQISLQKQPDEKKQEYFYKLWTFKECYIKAKGKGLYIPLNSFTINITKCNVNVVKDNTAVDAVDAAVNDYFYQNFLDNDTIYAICSINAYTLFEQIVFCIDSFLKELTTLLFL